MSKEFKIGLIALVSGLVLYFGLNFLKGTDLFAKTSKYYVVYDNVGGLSKSNPVIISGLSVGKVTDIKLMQRRKNKILVEITIDQDIQLGDSTVAELSSDLLGNKSILLKVGPLNKVLLPRDTLKSYINEGLFKYLESVEPIANNLTITITRINEILLGLEGSGELVYQTIADLQKTTRDVNIILTENRGAFKETMDSTKILVGNINQRVKQLEPVLRKTSVFLDSINSLEFNTTLVSINELTENLNQLVLSMNDESGTLGKLINQDSIHVQLHQLMKNMDALVVHFNTHPKDFLKPLGRKHEKMKGLEKKEN